MKLSTQARTISEIVDCLCELFNNQGAYDPYIQSSIENMKNDLNNMFNETKLLLSNAGFPSSIESNEEDMCQQVKNLSKLINTLLIKGISTGSSSQFNSHYNAVLNHYNLILSDGDVDVCQDGSTSGQLFKINVPCACRIIDLQGKLSGSVSEDIDELVDIFNLLKDEVDLLSPAVIEGTIEWPEDDCEKLKIMEKLLNLLINVPGLDLTNLNNLFDQFVNKVDETKNSLASIGIHPCEGEVDFLSSHIYLQAAGSDGSDFSSPGVHLRWTFMEKLAEVHLPKGNLTDHPPYSTEIMHNKSNDFVRIYKIPYLEKVPLTIDFTTLDLSDIDINISTNEVEWKFFINQSLTDHIVSLKFLDKDNYNSANQSSPISLIKTYNGVIEIKVLNKPMFAGEFYFSGASGNTEVKYEAISEFGNISEEDRTVSARLMDQYSGSSNFNRKILNEAIGMFRISTVEVNLDKIELETYHDFYFSNLDNIHLLRKYALSIDDNEVFDRLEDTSRFTINEQWPAFNDGTKVLTETYKSKWNDANGIKSGVEKYLQLSKTDIYASEEIPADDPEDSSVFPVQYIDLLNLIANDFHIARMLGFGDIDEIPSQDDQTYLYFVEYNLKTPDTSETVPHLFLSLPTGVDDLRLPETPIPKPVEYGYPANDPFSPFIKTDSNGYSLYSEERIIRLNRELFHYEEAGLEFFEKLDLFDLGIHSRALAFGIEYRDDGSAQYIKPEITTSSDTIYESYDATQPNNRVLETILAYEADNALFIHKENSEGIHHYALYGVNWFSRASPSSIETSTDETKFRLLTGLLPPSNVNAQMIQSDSSPLYFTEAERSNFEDKVKIKFDWNHAHNNSYQRANKIEIFFREQPLLEVNGKIDTIDELNEEELILNTTSYDILSTMPSTTESPLINSANISKFIGGKLTAGGNSYTIINITNPGNTPFIHISPQISFKTIERDESDNENEDIFNKYEIQKVYTKPTVGMRFSAVENPDNEVNWTKLNQTINIDHLSNYTEQITETDGQITTLTLGGISDTADIVSLGQNGLYQINFPNESLADHSQKLSEFVFWEAGIVRVNDGNQFKELRVSSIISQNPLQVIAYDPDYLSGTLPNPSTVNFHPSYMVYLDQEIGIFDESMLFPSGEDEEKITYLALRAIDDTDTPVAQSSMSSIIQLETHRVYETLIPEKPLGATYATRPDVFGKSTYTFDSKVITAGGRRPYGMMFLRANEQSILDALYQPNTVSSILSDLSALPTNEFHVNRFTDLANVILESSSPYEFKEYDGYRFPEPDSIENNLNNATYSDFSDKTNRLREVVNSAFVPLTKDPVIYKNIKLGKKTENKQEIIRDDKGNLLSHSDPLFDPYPMIRKFQEGGGGSDWKVRFSDYTIEGASANEYFYFSREIDHKYRFGERSEIAGPIKLINSFPPKQVEIKSMNSILADPAGSQPSKIEFEISNYEESENINKVRIYRTTSISKSANLRLMKKIGDFNLDNIYDDFSDFDQLPFGETIYYRLIALRKIINEQDETEFIPSEPSRLVETVLLDNNNPNAPHIEVEFIDNPPFYENIILIWPKTAHNGKYFLFKMTDSGTWEKIFEIETNEEAIIVPIEETSLASNQLMKFDLEGNEIFHRFKVDSENSNGLMNLAENITVV